jgi:hypothetical protein
MGIHQGQRGESPSASTSVQAILFDPSNVGQSPSTPGRLESPTGIIAAEVTSPWLVKLLWSIEKGPRLRSRKYESQALLT